MSDKSRVPLSPIEETEGLQPCDQMCDVDGCFTAVALLTACHIRDLWAVTIMQLALPLLGASLLLLMFLWLQSPSKCHQGYDLAMSL